LSYKTSAPRLYLKNIKKHSGLGTLTRGKSTRETLTHIIPISKKIGVTRVSDITQMDRLYISNYSAILPGTEDSIWVYSGKGITNSGAKASALMEAIERYSSLSTTYARNFIQGSYLELSKSYNNVLHPDEVVEPVNKKYNDKDSIIDFLTGFDLLNNEMVLVPAEIALYRHFPKRPASRAFSHSHTNGLASGNVVEEAVCHALCEVVERDAVSIADLCASSIPYNILQNIINSLEKEKSERHSLNICPEDKFVDNPNIFPDVDISEFTEEFEPLRRLINKFNDAHIPLMIKDITQKDICLPTFVASSIEWISHDYGYFAKGYGTHPDARIALIRAITEASQTRAINIQGARDDLKKIRYNGNDEIYKRKWQFMPSKSMNNHEYVTKFSDIETHTNKDILDDINLILNNLRNAGLKKAIIVDLTNPDIGIPVVRSIVPGLETFEVNESIMGARAKECFRNVYSC
jgi:thioglycine synthase